MSQARSNKEMQLTTPLTAIAPYKSSGRKQAFNEQNSWLLAFADRRLWNVAAAGGGMRSVIFDLKGSARTSACDNVLTKRSQFSICSLMPNEKPSSAEPARTLRRDRSLDAVGGPQAEGRARDAGRRPPEPRRVDRREDAPLRELLRRARWEPCPARNFFHLESP
jgi:hypothetical protein